MTAVNRAGAEQNRALRASAHAAFGARAKDDKIPPPQSKEKQLKRFVIGVVAALAIGHAAAVQQFGVEVYPGAKASPEVNAFLKEQLKVDGHAYVTGDSVQKVTAFYQKQPGLKVMPGADAKSSGFTGKGLMVTVQNPWMDMKSGKMVNSTLVSIVKQ